MLLSLLLALAAQSDGQFSYLRSARLTPALDTIDTFTSEAGGAAQRGSGTYVIRTIRVAPGERWEIVDAWYDSAGHETARQSVRTAPGGLMTERDWVRADVDSASMLVTKDHVTSWVVHAGQPPQLYDGDAIGERYTLAVVVAAVGKARGAIGTRFPYPGYSLYGSPVETRIDSLTIVRRDTLHRGATALAVVVLQRSNGGQLWVDETTGSEVASRGNAGPGRWWWHVRRGVTPPAAKQNP